MTFRIVSDAFADGEAVPKRFTCEGEDVSPPPSWSGAPQETRSFVLFCDDPDAPRGTFHTWGGYDIPAEQAALEDGMETEARLKGIFERS